MPGEMGLSFAPTAQNTKDQPAGGSNATPIQDAIRVLSLRIPSFAGGRSGSFSPLLGGEAPFVPPGMPGMGGDGPMDLEELLRRMFGQGGAPAPVVRPGDDIRMPAPSPGRPFVNVPNPPQQGQPGEPRLATPGGMQPSVGGMRRPMPGGRGPLQRLP
jgi:hypothetical protein